mmetsp:Transcript_21711/g.59695  ORF Transcript_21711/g.59695 Transcript_21711/m.59695 type:complete len:82 (-) Transcript_21711:266-511(-)
MDLIGRAFGTVASSSSATYFVPSPRQNFTTSFLVCIFYAPFDTVWSQGLIKPSTQLAQRGIHIMDVLHQPWLMSIEPQFHR